MPSPTAHPGHRLHWVCLAPHLQGMVLRTCLPAHGLRQLMAPFTDVLNPSDFALRCEAARLASQHAGVARALQGLLDQRHREAIEQCSRARTEADLLGLWEAATRSGEVRGACWALLTDRRSTPRLSGLISRDIEALTSAASAQRERDAAEIGALRTQVAAIDESWRLSATLLEAARDARERAESLSSALMFQVGRREQAEVAALAAEAHALRLEQETIQLQVQLGELGRELTVVEEQLRGWMNGEGAEPTSLGPLIRGRKLLYVGGRPSANPSIRALVERHGGEYRRHEGSVIDPRNELLLAALAWADLVVAPLDCVDRESAVALQRACQHNGLDYVPLRTASVASFAAGLCTTMALPRVSAPVNRLCLRHG